jgi:hypothetical protein
MIDEELLELNSQGLIPGPKESEEDFLSRVRRGMIREKKDWIPRAHLEWAALHLKEVFDIFYSNKSLAPWEGAAAWIENGSVSSIQLRVGFKKGSYLGLYKRDEVIAHEAVHAARCAFNEEKFEEFFAFLVSEKKWRRVLGPFLQRPWEVWPFFICASVGIFLDLAPLFCGAVLWASMGFWRLVRRHGQLKRASEALLKVVGEEKKTRAVLFRLTDEEILRFSRGENVIGYAEKQRCLRWRVIRLAYFPSL